MKDLPENSYSDTMRICILRICMHIEENRIRLLTRCISTVYSDIGGANRFDCRIRYFSDSQTLQAVV